MNLPPKNQTSDGTRFAAVETKARTLLSAIEKTIALLQESTRSAVEIREQIRKRSIAQRQRRQQSASAAESLQATQESDLLDLESIRIRMSEGDHSMDSARRSLMELMQSLAITPNQPLVVQDLVKQVSSPLSEQLNDKWETAKTMRRELTSIQADNQTVLIYLVDYYRQLLMADQRDPVKSTYGSKGTVEQEFESRIVKANC